MIEIKNISLQRGTKVLFENSSATIFQGQKIGLVGENGSGKTSLFGLLTGTLSGDNGEILKAGQCRIAHLEQEIPALPITAVDYVCQGDPEWLQLQQKIKAAEDNDEHEQLGELYAQLQDIDGYTLPARAAELLSGLGFQNSEISKTVAEFSGGWRMRLNLASVLISRADILLLDEPTNHLDLDAILWLEKWLEKYPAAILLISHDRDFLDGVVQHVIHVEHQTLKTYRGNYSTFEKTRAEHLALQHATFRKQQHKVNHLMDYVNRFRAKASKAKQAQSRLKMLERMTLVSDVHQENAFHFDFYATQNKSNPLLAIEQADMGYADCTILKKVNLSIPMESRIGLLGPNGAGKTTFIKSVAARLALLSGGYQAASGIKIGYFAQHQVDELDLKASPLQHLQRLDPQATEQALRVFLGRFQFPGEQALNSIHYFSGGEKARLALALLVYQKPNLLLLDEPTNHLDMEMREALVQALQGYDGAMILISHDRYLLRACVDEFWLVANHKAEPFPGDLEDYRLWCLAELEAKRKAAAGGQKSNQPIAIKDDKHIKKLTSRLTSVEQELASVEKAEQTLLIQLEEPTLYQEDNQATLKHCLAEKHELYLKREKLQEEWLSLSEKLEY